MDPPDCQNPVRDSGGFQQKGAGSPYFKAVDPKLQVADLKYEVGGGAGIRRDPPV